MALLSKLADIVFEFSLASWLSAMENNLEKEEHITCFPEAWRQVLLSQFQMQAILLNAQAPCMNRNQANHATLRICIMNKLFYEHLHAYTCMFGTNIQSNKKDLFLAFYRCLMELFDYQQSMYW